MCSVVSIIVVGKEMCVAFAYLTLTLCLIRFSYFSSFSKGFDGENLNLFCYKQF